MVSCALRRPACAMLRNCGWFVKSNFLGGLPKLPRPGQCQNRRRRKGNGRTKLLKRPEDKDLNGPHTQAPACYQFLERAIKSALSKDIAKPSRRGAAAQNFPRPDLTQPLPRSNADVGTCADRDGNATAEGKHGSCHWKGRGKTCWIREVILLAAPFPKVRPKERDKATPIGGSAAGTRATPGQVQDEAVAQAQLQHARIPLHVLKALLQPGESDSLGKRFCSN